MTKNCFGGWIILNISVRKSIRYVQLLYFMVQTGWVRKHFIAIQFQEKGRHWALCTCCVGMSRAYVGVKPQGIYSYLKRWFSRRAAAGGDSFRVDNPRKCLGDWRRFINWVWVEKLSRHSSSMDLCGLPITSQSWNQGITCLKLAAKAHENQGITKDERKTHNQFCRGFFVSWVSFQGISLCFKGFL